MLLSTLVNPKCNKLYQISLNSLVPPSASSFYIRNWNVEISHGSNFSCSVLSITGDTAKYLDFIYFCRRSTLYPHDTIPSCCHQWPTGLVLTKMEYWQTESVTKSFQKVLPYIIASLSSAPDGDMPTGVSSAGRFRLAQGLASGPAERRVDQSPSRYQATGGRRPRRVDRPSRSKLND